MPPLVHAPSSILLHKGLTPSAKLIWTITRSHGATGVSTAGLEAESAMSRHTVLDALSMLKEEGLLAPGRQHVWRAVPPVRQPGQTISDTWVAWPQGLLLDSELVPQARILYATLSLLPGFVNPNGAFTYRQLRTMTYLGDNTLRRAIAELRARGWLDLTHGAQGSPYSFTLLNPVAADEHFRIQAGIDRYRAAQHKGEALMREYLNLLVDSDAYEDHATPGLLINPASSKKLELDRFYPPGVAFEFQGTQHDGPTERYPSERMARQQQTRDLIKLGMCTRWGIRLVEVHAKDLSLTGMRELVSGIQPLREVKRADGWVAELEKLSRAYRRKAKGQPG